MKYHLKREGEDCGVFSLEELRSRRASGELTGSELVWAEGMQEWQLLASVLSQPPAIPSCPGEHPIAQAQSSRALVTVVLVIASILFVCGIFLTVWQTKRLISKTGSVDALHEIESNLIGQSEPNPALVAARKPVQANSNALTAADVLVQKREFRLRQYLDGYKLRGDHKWKSDALASEFIQNWIGCNFGGEINTNLPRLDILSDQLANDPSCTDPLVLAITGVNAVELHEALRRLERAVNGFENSKHKGYPKFYATVTLASRLIENRTDRMPVLDALALQRWKEAFTDGSFRPEDQAELADTLVFGWARSFFDRNAAAIISEVEKQGKDYQWLALTLKGEHEIQLAWQERGGGYVNTVSEKGWEGFREHLAAAREHLTRAWRLQQNLPLAPDRMIYVALGDSGIEEMRLWFDRTVAAQIDYPDAWKQMRWGLRPRWYGDLDSMLAFGVTALNTRRFDTDVPRMFFDVISDLESELKLPPGEHLYGRTDVWPHVRTMYEGYADYTKGGGENGWRSTYSAVAFLAKKYDVAQKQLQALNWQPYKWNLSGWGRDLSLMPLEVAARTGSHSAQVSEAESARNSGNVAEALKIYQTINSSGDADERTSAFLKERITVLDLENRLQSGEWVSFMPDTNFTGWHIELGNCQVLPDGALEISSDSTGHMLCSRVRVGMDFEVRGRFEIVRSSNRDFQGGLVMGMPQAETYNWFAFRMKHNSQEGDVASFSQNWTKRQILSPVNLNDHTNSFYFQFHDGKVTAEVNGRQIFNSVPPPKGSYVSTNEFLLGIGAFNDSNETVIRYRDIEARRPKKL